jgi:hypothetical protein
MSPLRQLSLLFSLFCAVAMTWLAPRLEPHDKRDVEVVQAVEEVVQNGIIRGSKEYNKDEYISGAAAVSDSRLFPTWTEGGKVFYKVRLHALDPRNFKDSSDVGTLAVRYIVMGQGGKSTVLRVDAVFAEDFRHTVHASNGSVESSEYKDIRDHIEALELIKQQTAKGAKEKQQLTGKRFLSASSDQTPAAASQVAADKPVDRALQDGWTEPSMKSPEQRVQELRRQVERLVRAPGAPLKSAPFQHREQFAILANWHRSLDCDFDALLVWRGNA